MTIGIDCRVILIQLIADRHCGFYRREAGLVVFRGYVRRRRF